MMRQQFLPLQNSGGDEKLCNSEWLSEHPIYNLVEPTEMWARKWKEAEGTATKTVFNYNVLDFAVYTFPFLGLAMVGFIYLELKRRSHQTRPERKLMNDLYNPLAVGSNVGILTGFEILIVCICIGFLSWTFYAHISNDFKKLEPIKSLKLNLWEYKVFKVATRLGLVAEACLGVLLFPILRGMAIFRIVGIEFEVSVRYHIWVGTTMMVFATLHGAGTFVIWGIKHCIQDKMWRWQPSGRIYLAGELGLVAGLGMWITSLPQMRRRHFETFYYTHHLYIILLIFLLFHIGDRHFYMVFPGIFLFVLDKMLRIIQSWPETCILYARVFPCKAIELTLPKDPKLMYSPASVIFVKIPHISKYQWHSFTITSSCRVENQTMSIIIKSEGWWTNALYNILILGEAGRRIKCLPVAVEGPYGPISVQDYLRYDTLILVAGGIGITPFLSILQEIVSLSSSSSPTPSIQLPKRLLLIYSVKKSQDISLLNPILAQLLLLDVEQSFLKLNVFVTREIQSQSGSTTTTLKQVVDEVSSQVQTINFDTTSLRRCCRYAVYGVEDLNWMAAIIGLSSVTFVLVQSCLNLTIRPFGHKVVPSSVMDLLLLCSFTIAIIGSSLLTIFLRWKRTRKEHQQFTPPLVLTHQIHSSRLAEDHEIHFGGRPDFKQLFGNFSKEIGGSDDDDDVGVFVCGPESMKESVALTCKPTSNAFIRRDGQKKKLSVSFHSLNFSF